MEAMIEGIKIEMTTAELKKHVISRAAFHTTKAKWYAKQGTSLRSGRSDMPNMSNDPVSSLERSREDHEKRAAFFSIIAKHLVPSETYRLNESDLTRLEFASQYFG
jgi:hypothetical protein